MQNTYEALLERKNYLITLLKAIQSNQSKLKPIEGHLRATTIKGAYRYYWRRTDPVTKTGTEIYLPKKELNTIQTLAQQDYNQKMIRSITAELAILRRCLSAYNDITPETIYQKLHPARKSLVTPYIPDWDEYAQLWKTQKSPLRSLVDPDSGFTTEQGEVVRSKSEKIIADKYHSLGIYYIYEKPLLLLDRNKRITLHPDFTILKKGEFQECYHEHFGMMDHPDYCKKALQKISLYRKNGIFEGDRLLLTFETNEQPLNVLDLQSDITRLFMT